MSLLGAKRRGNLKLAATSSPGLSYAPAGCCEIATAPAEPRNDKLGSASLPCHCEERSDAAISSRYLRIRRGLTRVPPDTARLPRLLRSLAMTNLAALPPMSLRGGRKPDAAISSRHLRIRRGLTRVPPDTARLPRLLRSLAMTNLAALPPVSLRGAKRRGNLKLAATSSPEAFLQFRPGAARLPRLLRSLAMTNLAAPRFPCHCEERSDAAISSWQQRVRRGFPMLRPGTARLPRLLRSLAMTNRGLSPKHYIGIVK